jgi:uncharacterized membrane protein YhaH (DUF805 family)
MDKNQTYFDNFIANYANFSGRATRKEFWLFQLAAFVVSLIITIIVSFSEKLGIINTLFSLFIFIPSISVSVRRLHDIGKSGYWLLPGIIMSIMLIILIPLLIYLAIFSNFESFLGASTLLVLIALVYNIVMLVFFVTPSQKTKNKYDEIDEAIEVK